MRVTATPTALKTNKALTSLEYAATRPITHCQQPAADTSDPVPYSRACILACSLTRLGCSLFNNGVGADGAKHLSEALRTKYLSVFSAPSEHLDL